MGVCCRNPAIETTDKFASKLHFNRHGHLAEQHADLCNQRDEYPRYNRDLAAAGLVADVLDADVLDADVLDADVLAAAVLDAADLDGAGLDGKEVGPGQGGNLNRYCCGRASSRWDRTRPQPGFRPGCGPALASSRRLC